ncbi:MAG: YIP1 family protein [Pseudomonadota bacterium]
MLRTVLETAAESFRAPREAARRIAEVFTTLEGVGVLFGLAYCLNAILLTAAQLAFGREGAGGTLSFVVLNLVISGAAFVILTGLVYGCGRLFGGTARLIEVAAVVAWHSLVTVPFTPFIAGGFDPASGEPGPGFLLQLALIGVALWLLVNFVAEVHGFTNAWRVAGVMFAGLFMAGMILPILFAGFI